MGALDVIVFIAGVIATDWAITRVRAAQHRRKLAAEQRIREIAREEISERDAWLAVRSRYAQEGGGE